ncbi:MAG: hypothetical protein KAW09_09295, partial [Thermoplasmata archaeon]|nr:hypothetical protein [Thermoplasmata archaeon]
MRKFHRLGVHLWDGDMIIEGPLTFMIESGDRRLRTTPFALLPYDWITLTPLLEMSTYLPTEPSETRDSWIRNVINRPGANFMFYYLSELDGKNLEAMIGTFKMMPYKVFLANHDESRTLIEESSSADSPSLLLTYDHNLAQYFRSGPAVNVVPLAGRRLGEVGRDIGESILGMFGRTQGRQTGPSRRPEPETSNRYCRRKEFLDPVRVTVNLLTRANELLLAYVRGALP